MINFKNKRELTFFIISILITVLVLTALISSIIFLATTIENVLGSENSSGQAQSAKFDIESVKKLQQNN